MCQTHNSIRQYGGKCLIKPQKEKVLSKLAELRSWLNHHKQVKQESVIQHFNQILPGWSNHYRHAVSKEVFAFVSHEIWRMLWRWCKRRHPNKSKDWIRKKYFSLYDNVSWTFLAKSGNKTIYLFDVGKTKILRHIKVKGTASPDDPSLQDYWQTRATRCKTKTRRRKEVTKAQATTGSGARAV